MWMVCWVRIRRSSNWYGEDWWMRYGAGLNMLRLCLLWRCQCTYALTLPGGLLSVISRCFRHWSEYWVSRYFLYDFSLLCGLARVTLCGIGDFGSRRGGSTCPTAFCMRSSSVSKGTACSRGCHKHQRKCWIVVGGEEYILNLSCASCRFCVMYREGIPVSVVTVPVLSGFQK